MEDTILWIFFGAIYILIGRYCLKQNDKLTHMPPPKREWVGLTEEQLLNAAKLVEAGNYMVAFQRIQQWLKEKNT